MLHTNFVINNKKKIKCKIMLYMQLKVIHSAFYVNNWGNLNERKLWGKQCYTQLFNYKYLKYINIKNLNIYINC